MSLGLKFITAIITLATLLSPAFADCASVTGYAPAFEAFQDDGVKVAIRRFSLDGKEKLLWVDAKTLVTGIMDAASEKRTKADVAGTPYLKALDKFNSPPYLLQNHGIRHSQKNEGGVFITADLCPSGRALDRSFFEAVLGASKDRPIEVALAVSGRWVEDHADDLDWIKGLEEKGLVNITWVNHSHTHPFDPKAPIAENFLLASNVDLDAEVLKLEIALIERGMTPSPFFRFPGLVSNERLVRRLKGLGLIPVGSDAWLAKGEEAVDGSIILVHANGNEPIGIKKLKEILSAGGKGLKFLRLRDAM